MNSVWCESGLARDGGNSVYWLNPNRIPKRIVANLLHKSCPHWVGHDITRDSSQTLFMAHGVIMVTLLPKASSSPSGSVDRSSTKGFGPAHQLAQRILVQFNKPVEMIRHDYPRQRTCQS